MWSLYHMVSSRNRLDRGSRGVETTVRLVAGLSSKLAGSEFRVRLPTPEVVHHVPPRGVQQIDQRRRRLSGWPTSWLCVAGRSRVATRSRPCVGRPLPGVLISPKSVDRCQFLSLTWRDFSARRRNRDRRASISFRISVNSSADPD